MKQQSKLACGLRFFGKYEASGLLLLSLGLFWPLFALFPWQVGHLQSQSQIRGHKDVRCTHLPSTFTFLAFLPQLMHGLPPLGPGILTMQRSGDSKTR